MTSLVSVYRASLLLSLEGQELFLDRWWHFRAGRIVLAEHHGEGLIDPGNRRGERRRPACPIPLVDMGTVRASDANLAVIEEFGIVSHMQIRVAGFEDLYALLPNKAQVGGEPVDIIGGRQGHESAAGVVRYARC